MADILKALSSLQDALGHMRADRATLNDFHILSKALARFDHLSVGEFARLCEQIDVGASQRVERPAQTTTAAAVDAYVQSLTDAQGDKAAFEAVVARMKADRALKGGDVGEIARRYVGGTSKYAKKADAYKDIELRFEAHRRAVSRLDAASDIF